MLSLLFSFLSSKATLVVIEWLHCCKHNSRTFWGTEFLKCLILGERYIWFCFSVYIDFCGVHSNDAGSLPMAWQKPFSVGSAYRGLKIYAFPLGIIFAFLVVGCRHWIRSMVCCHYNSVLRRCSVLKKLLLDYLLWSIAFSRFFVVFLKWNSSRSLARIPI